MPLSSTSAEHHSTATPSPTSGLFISDTNSKSSTKTTTIIVAVLAAVAAFVLIFFVVRSIRHWMQKRATVVPLPPVQPIAHHREHQLAQFAERKFMSSTSSSSPSSRPGSWAMQQFSNAPDRVGSGSMSDTSLIPSEHRRTQSNHNTTNSDTPSPNISQGDEKDPLPHPSPAFHGTGNPRDSSSSFGSIPERSSGTPSPLPFPDTPPPSSQSHSSTHPLIPSNSTSSAPIRPLRQRPTSVISNTSRRSQAGTAATTIRGAPHGPHSNVQIILPTPLAPGLSPYGRGEDGEWLHEGVGKDVREGVVRSDSRLSIADKWAGVPIGRSERDERERGRNDFARNYADPRDSIGTARTFSTISSTHAPSPPQTFVRSLPPSSFQDHSLTPPPQTSRIPSAHNTNLNPLDEAIGKKKERGRPTSLLIGQSRSYSRSDSNSMSLPRTRN